MATLQLPTDDAASVIRPLQRVRVMVRAQWNDEAGWVEAPYLEPKSAEAAVAPAVGEATFHFAYGKIKREDQAGFAHVDPADLRDQFVRIDLLGDVDAETGETASYPLWYGFFGRETREEQKPTAEGPQGDQPLVAYELLALLDRTPITGSWINVGGNAAFIDAPITFNETHKRGLSTFSGNKSNTRLSSPWGTVESAPTAYVFDKNAEGPTLLWDHHDVAEYLLAYFPAGGPVYGDLDFTLGGQANELVATTWPASDVGGTVGEALAKVIDRRRGIGWCIRVMPGRPAVPATEEEEGSPATGEQLVVHIFTVFEETVSAGDSSIRANAEQAEIQLDDQVALEQAVATINANGTYDRILVRGALVKSCFTVSFADGTLEKAWTDGEETEYKIPLVEATTAAAYDAARTADKFAHVYTTYRIPPTWDWFTNPTDTWGLHNANPKLKRDGTVSQVEQAIIRSWGHTLLPTLPLENEEAEPEEIEYRKPFILIEYEAGKYGYVDRLNDIDPKKWPNGQADAHHRNFAIKVKMQPNHRLALNHWEGAVATGAKNQPLLDYTKIIATVCAETDERLQIIEVLTVPTGGGIERDGRVLVIDVPDAEFWWIADSTVVDVNADGTLKRYQGSDYYGEEANVLRSDADRLRRIAALAKAWYGRPRQSVRLTLKELTLAYPPGTLIKAVSAAGRREPVAAIVSRKSYDFGNHSTTIETGYEELEFARL